MNDSEIFDAGRLLIASLLEVLPPERKTIPIDTRAFALVAMDLSKAGNGFASKFWITDSSTGYRSHEFERLISLAYFGCLIEYLSPTYNAFRIKFSPRLAKRFLKELEDAARNEVLDVAREYLARTGVFTGPCGVGEQGGSSTSTEVSSVGQKSG